MPCDQEGLEGRRPHPSSLWPGLQHCPETQQGAGERWEPRSPPERAERVRHQLVEMGMTATRLRPPRAPGIISPEVTGSQSLPLAILLRLVPPTSSSDGGETELGFGRESDVPK